MKNATQKSLNALPALVTPQSLCAGYSAKKQSGFTLIELLVVVLIIGILAAVALPQYQKAVEKSKAIQGISLVKTLGQAASSYYLANGTFINNLEQLDVSLTPEQKEEFWCNQDIANACDKKEWGVALYKSSNDSAGITAWRTTGPYKGGGFVMYYTNGDFSSIEPDKLYCIERRAGDNAIAKARSYCPKIIKANGAVAVNNSDHYLMP